jgi:glycosyltransferase involved in cell wall biosynthesis
MSLHITYFFRKPRLGAFSIENLFLSIQQHFPKEVTYTNHFLSEQSNGLLNRLKLVKETFQKKGEINHITGDVNFITLLLPRNKTILTIHDIESLHRKYWLTNYLLKLFWLRIPVAKAKYVTVVSQATKQKLLEELPVDSDKVIVIPNVISSEFIYQPKTFNTESPNILQIGTKHNKNIERIIKALKGITCTFVIVGQLSEEHIKLLTKYKVEYVNYVNVSNQKLRVLYIQSDIVTFVSLFEGFGMPILEAQATGRPVITSSCSSMPEVAGKGAFLVNPYSVSEIRGGILKLINADDLRTKLISDGLENTKRFSNKVIAQQYLDLYKKL